MTPDASPIWRTRGQPRALAAVARMVTESAPHAVLLVGPPSVGKTTLAEDLAAGLLCLDPDRARRPCGACRACRLVSSGNHPDLHRLVPEGPGGQVVIGDLADPRAARGVRDLLHELAFLPVEGAARVAIIEGASSLNEDAQHALLKTLEEPPAGVTIVLCADEEQLLLPTIRSRCARVRLGPSGPRQIEALLAERALADPVAAGRLARIAEGRPGVALAYARAPEAVGIRDEIARTLLDLLEAPRARRLAVGRELLGRARDLAAALGDPLGRPAPEPIEAVDPAESGPAPKLAPAERRRAARQLLVVWRDVARDLAVVEAGGRRELRDPSLLEDLVSAADRLPVGAAARFLDRLGQVAELVAGNVGPELAIDVLVLAWPVAGHAA